MDFNDVQCLNYTEIQNNKVNIRPTPWSGIYCIDDLLWFKDIKHNKYHQIFEADKFIQMIHINQKTSWVKQNIDQWLKIAEIPYDALYKALKIPRKFPYIGEKWGKCWSNLIQLQKAIDDCWIEDQQMNDQQSHATQPSNVQPVSESKQQDSSTNVVQPVSESKQQDSSINVVQPVSQSKEQDSSRNVVQPVSECKQQDSSQPPDFVKVSLYIF